MSPFRSIALAVLAVLCPLKARAGYLPPAAWTLSITGSETAVSLGVDSSGTVWLAGNVWNTDNANVLLMRFAPGWDAIRKTGEYDRSGQDEGPPTLRVDPFRNLSPRYDRDNVLVAFTTSLAGKADATLMWDVNKYGTLYTASVDVGADEHVTAMSTNTLANAVTAGYSYNGAATVVYYCRFVRNASAGPAGFYSNAPAFIVSGTFWQEGAAIAAGGVAVDGVDNSWVAANEGGEVVLLEFSWSKTAGVIYDMPMVAPGFPRRYGMAGTGKAGAVARDVMGGVWVAGSRGSDACLWKFEADGDLLPGFPVFLDLGGNEEYGAAVIDELGNVFVAGNVDQDVLVDGYDNRGARISGFPMRYGGGLADQVRAGGIALDRARNLWIAATGISVAATGSTYAVLLRLARTPDPPTVKEGTFVLRARDASGNDVLPGGAVLNLLKAQTMAILAWPVKAGRLRAQVLSPRGELVRELTAETGGRELATLTWDGRNSAGNKVATGIYAVRVLGGGVAGVRRVAVVRKK